jgi:dTDP-L-rhamnose 4-epimerase
VGDIRHCFADVTLARERLGFQAQLGLEQGMKALATWLAEQSPEDLSEVAHRELMRRGLTR